MASERLSVRNQGQTAHSCGTYLRECRNDLGLTLAQAGRLLGVSQAHISLLERGHRRPTLEFLGKAALVYNADKGLMLSLAYPETRDLVNGSAIPVLGPKPVDRARDRALEEFLSDATLMKKLRPSPEEVELLSNVSLLCTATDARVFAVILNVIRKAIERSSRRHSGRGSAPSRQLYT